MPQITYDDSNLQRLWGELDAKNRKKALKGALRKCANMVKKEAVKKAKGYYRKAKSDPSKGVLAKVYKERAVGFKVYVSPRSRKSMHTNRQGLQKPVLFWGSLGTAERTTKGRRSLMKSRRKSKARRGRMPVYPFLKDADRSKGPEVTGMLRRSIVETVTKTAKKYGCKI